MKRKSILLIGILFFLTNSIFSQTVDNCKILTALNYFKSNDQFKKKIYAFFPKFRKSKVVQFNLSSRIMFIDISTFADQFKAKGYNVDYLLSYELFTKKYDFVSFKYPFLDSLIIPNTSTLFLSFSKPSQNFLIGEFGIGDPESKSLTKFGKIMKVFFRFTNEGLISDIIYAGAIYN